jgi:transposase
MGLVLLTEGTINTMAGNQGDSRSAIQEFSSWVLGIPISLGAIQKIIDRASAAIAGHYEHIGVAAITSEINHIDETSFAKKGTLQRLWVMTNAKVGFFTIHPHRSKEAFKALIRDWAGILVSDGYGVYCKWVQRQSCLAHHIRKARELSERKNPEIACFGAWALAELQRLSHMAHVQPSMGEWQAFICKLYPVDLSQPRSTGRRRYLCPKTAARDGFPVAISDQRGSCSLQQPCRADAALCRALAKKVPGYRK